jgi:uncharacterized protein (TIGR03067 family)
MESFPMKRALALLLLCSLPGLAAEPDPEPVSSTKAHLKKIQGTWIAVRLIEKGVDVTKKEALNLVFVFKKDQITVSEKGRREKPAGFKLDARKKPYTIDIFPEQGRDDVVRGIYKFDKDELTIAFVEGKNKARPKKFDDKDSSRIVLKRQKAK